MVLWLWVDVVFHEVKIACVKIEKQVPVRSQKSSAVQSAPQSATGVSESLLDVV